MSEVIVVTGAPAGLRRAIADRFARDAGVIGLIACGRSRLESARASLEALSGAVTLGAALGTVRGRER